MTLAIREGDAIRITWDGDHEIRGSVIRVSGSWIVFRPEPLQANVKPQSQDRLVVHAETGEKQSSVAGLWRAWKDEDFTLQLQSGELPDQRRSYFRAPIQLSLALAGPGTAEIPKEDYRIFLLEDLSGGGCRVRTSPEDAFVKGEEYSGALSLDDGETPLKLELTVVRVEPGAVAFFFAVIREKERQRILQTLFREYRAKRSAAKLAPESDTASH